MQYNKCEIAQEMLNIYRDDISYSGKEAALLIPSKVVININQLIIYEPKYMNELNIQYNISSNYYRQYDLTEIYFKFIKIQEDNCLNITDNKTYAIICPYKQEKDDKRCDRQIENWYIYLDEFKNECSKMNNEMNKECVETDSRVIAFKKKIEEKDKEIKYEKIHDLLNKNSKLDFLNTVKQAELFGLEVFKYF